MRWITASQLEQWAKSPTAKLDFPGLVADLARATSPDINTIRFPSGDKGQTRGFDGTLLSSVELLNVPEGKSYWEFGTELDYQGKAEKDLENRRGDARGDITFVCVSPHTWNKRDLKLPDWEAEQQREYGWKAVRLLDGSALEEWLQECPAVAAWHAKNTLELHPPEGARSTDEFWDDYSGKYDPALTEEVVLCARAKQAEQVIDTLLAGQGSISFTADSPDEVIAFTIAAIRRAKPEVRLHLEARTIVIDTMVAGRQLIAGRNMAYLLRGEATRSPRQFSNVGPTVVGLGRQQKNTTSTPLERPDSTAMGQALQSMKFDLQKGINLARGSGRSLTVLARQIPLGSYDPPEWAKDGKLLLPAILAGAWDTSSELDTKIVAELAGVQDYFEYEAAIRHLIALADPPLDNEGLVWKIRAPMDAFVEGGHLIGKEHLAALRPVMQRVFAEIIDDGDGVKKWGEKPRPQYSQWLKDGLATTLLLIAVWQKQARLNLPPDEGQRFADELVGNLPGLRDDHRLLTSLRQQLPLLAEAAPRPLLAALERMLEGEAESIRHVFDEKDGLIVPQYEHTGLLWALETLAWIPEYFGQSVRILSKLAAIDPGVKLINNPINSLGEIFLPWSPNSNASAPERLAAIDEIIKRAPAIGWLLLEKLLPKVHGVSHPAPRPRLRDAGSDDQKPMTHQQLWDINSAIISRAVDLAEDNIDRWLILISHIPSFAPADQRKVHDALERVLRTVKGTDFTRVWGHLRDEVAKHERYAKAQWALPADQLGLWADLARKYQPTDPISKAKWLFDDWLLDDDAQPVKYNAQRAEAVEVILRSEGADGVVSLAATCRLPHLVTEAIAALKLTPAVLESLLERSIATSGKNGLTSGLSYLFREAVGEEAAAGWIEGHVLRQEGVADLAVSLLLAWPNTPDTWRKVREFGPEIETSYWLEKNPLWMDGPVENLIEAMGRFMNVERPVAALETALNRLSDLPTDLLLRVLDQIPAELNSTKRPPSANLGYEIEKIFLELDKRDDTSAAAVAQRELTFQPLLEFTSRPLRLHRLMAADPDVYFSVLANVFVGEGDERPEKPDEAQRIAWRINYSLLSKFDQIPGVKDGKLDSAALTKWVDEVRRLATAGRRLAIADQYIGHVFAHSDADADGAWPHRVIRDEIERLQSDEVERGLQIERFNMRGAHFRDMYGGGTEERAFANQYREYADAIAAWPRTQAMLRRIAKDWDADAEREDVWAAQRRLNS